jgi:hypothetical protein
MMTDAEVAAAAAELRGLLEPDDPGAPWKAEARRRREGELRRALAVEYGRRRGWALAPGYCFPRRYLFDFRRHRRERYADLPRFFDHNFGFLARRRPAAVVTHPYDVDDEVRAAMQAWAAEHGLAVAFPSFPSWWFPGWTTAVEFARPEAPPEAVS